MSIISLDLPAGDPDSGCTIVENIPYTDNALEENEDDSCSERDITKIHELMDSAGLEPKLRKVVSSYLDTGSITATARANGVVPDTAKKRLKAAIIKMQAVA